MSHFGATVQYYLELPWFLSLWRKKFNGTQNIFKPNQDAQASKAATQPTAFSWPMWIELSLGEGLRVLTSSVDSTAVTSLCFVKPSKNVQVVEMKSTAHHCCSPGLPSLPTAASSSLCSPAAPLRACQTHFLGQFKSPIKQKRDPIQKGVV